jgi:hypothetical protein
MKSLSGWQRLGIVLSILWFLGWFLGLFIYVKTWQLNQAHLSLDLCIDAARFAGRTTEECHLGMLPDVDWGSFS